MAETAEHEIVLSYSVDGFNTELVCNADEDANCKNVPDCDCEYFSSERDEQGWHHTAYSWDQDDDVKHRHRSYKGCAFKDWMDDCVSELGSPAHFEAARFGVKMVWGGDEWTWCKADE